MQSRAYSQFATGRADTIHTLVGIYESGGGKELDGSIPYKPNCKALWDTGATKSCITQALALKLNLQPVGVQKMLTAGGEVSTEVYHVSLQLPNHIYISNLSVLSVNSLAGDRVEALIGMDVMSQMDIAITNAEGKTCFSIRMPSSGEIDFTDSAQSRNGVSIPKPKAKQNGKKHRSNQRKRAAKHMKRRNSKKR